MSVFYGRALTSGGGGSSTAERLRFTYTGQYNERLDDGVVELLTSGVLTVTKDTYIDAFLVGGGGSGAAAPFTNSYSPSISGAGGGGGGRTRTLTKALLSAGVKYSIVIGSGGASVRGDGNNIKLIYGKKGGATSAFGYTVEGGDDGGNGGGDGGSGGGGQGYVDSNSTRKVAGGAGGSNGADGGAGNYPGGTGQGTNTREFGESTGKLYAGGGGGGAGAQQGVYSEAGAGGEGGGGAGGKQAVGAAGVENTGGGGGGSSAGWNTHAIRVSGAGGSGIVCIRLHKKKPGLQFTYTGDHVKRDDGVVELLTSGTLTFLNPAVIDRFMVGGGSSGVNPKTSGTDYGGMGGGAGGYTRTDKKVRVNANEAIQIVIGAGGAAGKLTNTFIATKGEPTSWGEVSVDGGKGTTGDGALIAMNGLSGGSGGGGGVYQNSDYGSGGYNGGNGEDGITGSSATTGGTGQGSTTREFGEADGKLYAGGGGGGRWMSAQSPVTSQGGAGGGGTGAWAYSVPERQAATVGVANTGGGGGGGVYASSGYVVKAASGGSGIVCFREAAELPELAGTWVLNERLYAPENAFYENISFTVKTETGGETPTNRVDITASILIVRLTGAGNVTVYTFTDDSWGSKYKYWTFSTGATASDEFRAWLASNATKQA